jgi:hypothetical protein
LSISKLLPHCYPGSNVEKYYWFWYRMVALGS